MKFWILVFGLLAGLGGWGFSESLFDTQGFEAPLYVPGTVVLQSQPGMVWVQWDAAGNNANREDAVVQQATAYSGEQALALADTGGRTLIRANGLNVDAAVFYIDGWFKSEASNDPGAARITLRFRRDGELQAKLFSINTLNGMGSLFDYDDSNKNGVFRWGDWNRITIEVKLANNEYRVWIDEFEWFSGTLCKNGVPTELASWELDVEASDASRDPKGDFVFYVDDLSIGTVNPLPDRK